MAIAKIGGGFAKVLAKAGKKAKGVGMKKVGNAPAPKSIGKPINRINDKIVAGKAPKKTYATREQARNASGSMTGYTPKATSKQNKYKQNMKNFLGAK